MQLLVALPPAEQQQREPARPALVPLAPGQPVLEWAQARSVQAQQQVLAPPAQACWARALAEPLPLAPGRQQPTPRWPRTALAQRRGWAEACSPPKGLPRQAR